jgi:pyruvate/2-oxoglutarate dehydrogenase complex dihydrolipoamide acyltransferase (E2) component
VVTRGGVVEVGLSFEGRVRRLLVSVGQPVEEGSVLAEVEVPELAVAAAEVAGLGHEREVLGTRRERVVQLVNEGLAPREQLEGVDGTLAELGTRRDVALAKLRAAHVDRADQAHLARHGVLRVRAPRAGVLVELLLAEGGVVGPGAPLARLVGPSEAVVQVTTARRPPTGPVTVVTDDGTLTSTAQHEPVLDPETGLFHTFYPLTEALPHGTRVTVRFPPRRP